MTTDDQVPEAGSTRWYPAGDGAPGGPADGSTAQERPVAPPLPYQPRTDVLEDGATARRDPKRRRSSKAVVIGGTLALAAAMTGVAVTSQSSSRSSVSAEPEGWTNEFGETVTAPAELTEDYAQVCQDTQTGERVEDQWCEDPSIAQDQAGAVQEDSGEEQEEPVASGGHVSHGWFFIPLSGGRTVPAVGSPVRGGTTQAPAGRTVTKVPASGGSFAKAGTVSKGGFGTKGGGAGS